MPQTVLVLKSSPRQQSNSSILAEKAAAGAGDAGAQVEVFDLHRMDIRPCDACDTCQETGLCVIKDDMQLLYPRLLQADGILLASPVYWFTFSAQAKLCIDRWYALESEKGSALKGKRFALVMTYGDSDPYTSGAINAFRTFQDMLRYVKAELVGILYASAHKEGVILEQAEVLEKAYRLGERLAGSQRG